MELELVCIRHGRTQWNKDKRYLGHTDMGILPESLTELMPVKEELEGRKFHQVFCSDLKRCKETLAYIYPISPDRVVFDRRLREMDFGDWEGQTYDQLKDISIYRDWLDNPESVVPPRGESWGDFQQRLNYFMDSLVRVNEEDNHDNVVSSVLLVTHGGVIRQLASMMIRSSKFWDYAVDPGSILTLKLTFHDGKWKGCL